MKRSKADEYASIVFDLFTDGRKKRCRDAYKKHGEFLRDATDEELQDIAEKTGTDLKSLMRTREEYRQLLK